jgi:hypothetical protein
MFLINTKNGKIHPNPSFVVKIGIFLIIRIYFLIHYLNRIKSSLDLCNRWSLFSNLLNT